VQQKNFQSIEFTESGVNVHKNFPNFAKKNQMSIKVSKFASKFCFKF